jgi:excisionase family DNA binding protein
MSDKLVKLAFSPNETAFVAGVGRTFVFSEIKEGRLEAHKAGSRTLITRDAITTWLKSLPQRGSMEAAEFMGSKEKGSASFEDGNRLGGIRRRIPSPSIRHPDSTRDNDRCETPEVATLSLLAVEPLPPRILDPACGRGGISQVLRSAGHTVIENDIVDYGQGQDSVQDFLNLKPAQAGEIDAVVTNPPHRLAHHFVRHALTLCPRVFMLLRFTFYESACREDVLDGAGLIRVHVFRNRLPMMHDSWVENRASNSVAFAWFIWERGHLGSAELDRISWNRGA